MSAAAVKELTYIVQQLITDEELRKRIFYLIAVPVVIVVLLISSIYYVMTMPFTAISEYFGENMITTVSDFRIDYGYDQLLSPLYESYIESDGQSYDGVTFADGSTAVVYYNQMDARWKNILYGKQAGNTIGVAGCGPTSLAIVVSSLTSTRLDPIQSSRWASANGYYVEGSGSSHAVIPDGAKHFGLNVEGATIKEPQKIVDALASGKLVVAIMGKGHFTTSGHFIVLRGVTSSGKILVADPASYKKSEMEWDLQIFLNEARKGASAGGPFWIVSK